MMQCTHHSRMNTKSTVGVLEGAASMHRLAVLSGSSELLLNSIPSKRKIYIFNYLVTGDTNIVHLKFKHKYIYHNDY